MPFASTSGTWGLARRSPRSATRKRSPARSGFTPIATTWRWSGHKRQILPEPLRASRAQLVALPAPLACAASGELPFPAGGVCGGRQRCGRGRCVGLCSPTRTGSGAGTGPISNSWPGPKHHKAAPWSRPAPCLLQRRIVMRIGIYARVSTQRQAQANGLAQQLERLQAHALQQGWSVAAEDIFRDDGYSGASLKRPGLERLRDRAAMRLLDCILITAPDRLARQYVHQVLLLEELTATGCQVEFLDRPMTRDPHDQLLLQIRGAVAEYERSLIAERMRRGRLHKLQSGLLLPWTKPPYGFHVDPERPRDPAGVRQDEAEAAVVATLFALYV